MKEYGQTDTDFSITNYTTFQRKVQRLEHILQIISLFGIIEEVPLQKWLTILAWLYERFEQFSVHELCEALNVSLGTFYNHIFGKADCTKYTEEQQQSPSRGTEANCNRIEKNPLPIARQRLNIPQSPF